jgi:hypothetical protein
MGWAEHLGASKGCAQGTGPIGEGLGNNNSNNIIDGRRMKLYLLIGCD